MTWIKSSERLPGNDQWCWICGPNNWIERAVYDSSLEKWVIFEGVEIWGADKITHWQPYFTPVPPGEVESFLRGFKNDV